ncbi:hypothetical protein MKX03_000068 [Papaver bracteatum]|nr:hypothetical protein MKX03_000068 [Papaver bracteatum]
MIRNLDNWHDLWFYLLINDKNRVEPRKDKEALEAIRKSCSAEMLPHIIYAEFARDAWKWLEELSDLDKKRENLNSNNVPEVDKVLTRRNYGKWKTYMKNVLLSKYVWEVVDGSDTNELQFYKMKNHNALLIIRMSCGEEMFLFIDEEDNAHVAWRKLEDELGTAASNFDPKEIAIDHELLTIICDYDPEDEKALDAIKASCATEMLCYILYVDCARNAWKKLATLVADLRADPVEHYADMDHIATCEQLKLIAEKIPTYMEKVPEADKVLTLSTGSNYYEWETYVEALFHIRFINRIHSGNPVLEPDKSKPEYKIKEACAIRIIKESCAPEMMPYIFRSRSQLEALTIFSKQNHTMDQKDGYMAYSRLLHAVQKNGFREQIQDRNGEHWRGAHKFFQYFPEALSAEITEDGSTALHVAVRLGRADFVRDLLKLMNEAQSSLQTHQDYNEDGLNAVTIAAVNGNEEIMHYLYPLTRKNNREWSRTSVVSLLTSAARLGAFDIVRDLPSHYKSSYVLGQDNYGMALLSVLAEMPSAFPSGNQFGFLGGWIYQLAGSKTHKTLLKALKFVPGVQQVLDCKEKHDRTAHIIRNICALLPNLDPHQLEEYLIYEAIERSITHGIIELFENLIDTNPYLEHYKDENQRGWFQLAIMARQENIFQYISQMGPRNQSIALLDKIGNNALHCAAYWDPLTRLDKVHGPALQMQREIQWFQEVERRVPPGMKNKKYGIKNKKNKTPRELFSVQHDGLAKEAEKWMKETAQACMIVTTLIATVMFAAAFTLPGGSDQNTGRPLRATTTPFKIFIISDAVSLFSSCTSVLMFFAILTSRYAEIDFLTSLPKKMILGLSTLFISIATMMATFAATLVIVLRGEASWVYIPVSVLASIPVILLGLLQLPLFINIVSSTYGRGIFHRKKIVYAPLTGISYGLSHLL